MPMDFKVHSVNFRVNVKSYDGQGNLVVTEVTKNTWEDFHLVPAKLPVFEPPGIKTNYIDIPGGDGSIDASTALTGFPLFQNRSGSFDFDLLDDNYYPVDTYTRWSEAYSDLMDFLHGQKIKCFLQDDADYYYEGRFAVKGWVPGQKPTRITIEYNVGPYKLNFHTTDEEWLWDPFVFPGGIIRNGIFKALVVNPTETRYDFGFDDESIIGTKAVRPEVIVDTSDGNGIYIKVVNHRYTIDMTNAYPDEPYPDGSGTYAGIVFAGGQTSIFVKTARTGITGHVTFKFRPGRL